MKTVLYFALGLLLVACKKDAPEAELPAATQTGANTGGCLINGQSFVAASYGGSLLSNPIPALQGGFAFDSVYYVTLSGNYQGQRTSVMLFLKTQIAGTYNLNQNTQYYPQGDPLLILSHATVTMAGSGGEVYVTNAYHVGQVILSRADLNNGISAGTFEFTAASTFDPTKTVTVTNGRFDRKQ